MTQSPLPPSDPLAYASYLPPPKARPTSVTVIAIIGIIYASLGVLGGVCSLPQWLGLRITTDPVMDGMLKDRVVTGYMIGTLVAGFIMSIVLLFAAYGLLSLKPRARRVMIYYAIVYAAFLIIGQVMNWLIIMPRTQPITTAALQKNPMFNTPGMKNFMQVFQSAAICFGVVLLIWPVSILYVLTRDHVKAAFARSGAQIID